MRKTGKTERSNKKTCVRITISGQVQGIGFRPYVYRLATGLGLAGSVRNTQTGVIVEVEGNAQTIRQFTDRIQCDAPPIARIDEMTAESLPLQSFRAFTIQPSSHDALPLIQVTPDLALCSDCRTELLNPTDRRYHYPFINCTNCGPRFTIIRGVPYDRCNTTMAQFTMCPECAREYHNPANRRYHAQPNACPRCGPQVSLWTAKGKAVTVRDIFGHVRTLLKQGKVVAIKGLGGYHLGCNALDKMAVKTLRQRKYREDKPFAVMMCDLGVIRRFCVVSAEEAALLQSYRSPIVLLKKRTSPQVASLVAPENPYLGVILPYTPLHVLLFDTDLVALVMTSGNYSQEPIAFRDEDARTVLAPIADYYLTHNRPIQRRCDDSVVRVLDGKESLIRRARGYAPTSIRLFRTVGDILACGAELKNTFCFGKGYYAYVSHHLGDLENYETLEAFEQGIEDFQQLFALKPRYIAYDLHPDYLSTKYALAQTALQPIAVQHHHAHIASCMAEHGLDEAVIGIALDGLGLGSDGTLWGGEVLICTYGNFERIAHLRPVRLPGGAQAIKEPWRMGAVYLEYAIGPDFIERPLVFCQRLKQRGWERLARIATQRQYSPLISSLGRLFDAVSAILGVRETINYEGQAAIELEYLAMRSRTTAHYPFAIDESRKPAIIDVRELFRTLALDIERGVARPAIARKFHNSMVCMIRDCAVLGRRSHGLKKVVLSGGCFQNVLLLSSAVALLLREGFTVFTHHQLPPNDGCISVGQLLIASAKLEAGKASTDLQ